MAILNNDSQHRKHTAKATYDFSTCLTVAAGTHTLPYADIIPTGAIITSVIFNTTTALATCTNVSVTGGGIDLVAAQTRTNNMVDTNTVVAIMKQAGNTGSSATVPYLAKLTTSTAPIKLVTTGADLTTGLLDIYVEYYMP